MIATTTRPPTPPVAPPSPSLAARYASVRARTVALCEPLETEDYVVSSMPDVSPAKWHLAHTSWFFETFVLAPHDPSYRTPDPKYAFLFNSYYVQAGERHCRAQRGLVTRPTVAQVYAYRTHVDEAMAALLGRIGDDPSHPVHALVTLGCHHEQQHQELLLTDIKHVFFTNPVRPAYRARAWSSELPPPATWHAVPDGLHVVGAGDDGFTFDNERPAHRAYLHGAELASRLVTNAEYLAFIEDGGYRRPELWLSNGWATVQTAGWRAPLYWEAGPDGWQEFTLAGQAPLEPGAPVCHLSHYEADAYARWAGARLPTEFEWEVAARSLGDGAMAGGTWAESPRAHPDVARGRAPLEQLFGDAWQWTQSAYLGYPGYRPAAGAIGEYNGKFMSDQWVLRGASCATPRSHARITYRNFFPSDARWQFTGLRLARDAA